MAKDWIFEKKTLYVDWNIPYFFVNFQISSVVISNFLKICSILGPSVLIPLKTYVFFEFTLCNVYIMCNMC